MAEFARPFKVTYPDGVLHGVQFPDGFCLVRYLRPLGRLVVATEFKYLGEQMPMDGAVVEWADGGSENPDAPCGSCDGNRWVDDENWQPDPDDIRDRIPIVRTPGNGRIPCGACNHGGWNEPDGHLWPCGCLINRADAHRVGCPEHPEGVNHDRT